jgi:hypothetical protein
MATLLQCFSATSPHRHHFGGGDVPHPRFGRGWLLAAWLFAGWNGALLSGTAVAAGDEAAGQALAARIRSAMPTNGSEIHGALLLDSKAGHLQVPVDCQVKVSADQGIWDTVYKTAPTNQTAGAQLVIIHHTDAPNQYVYGGAPVLPDAVEDLPFAGSDFSLGELGLEFLHWPGQSQLKSETRLSRACFVLESTNNAADGIVRVKSWIDQENLIPLVAEAYDGKGIKIKEFTMSGSKKTLEKLDIKNKKNGSHTVLKFDIPRN